MLEEEQKKDHKVGEEMLNFSGKIGEERGEEDDIKTTATLSATTAAPSSPPRG